MTGAYSDNTTSQQYNFKTREECVKAKALLTNKGQEFQVIEIVENNAGEGQINKMDFIDAFPGIRAVPYITKTDGSAYKTYAELHELLEN
jgi:glutaredoxin